MLPIVSASKRTNPRQTDEGLLCSVAGLKTWEVYWPCRQLWVPLLIKCMILETRNASHHSLHMEARMPPGCFNAEEAGGVAVRGSDERRLADVVVMS